jgi:hypothetical protein
MQSPALREEKQGGGEPGRELGILCRVKVECVLANPLLVEHVGPVLRVLAQRGISATFVSAPPARRFVGARDAKVALHERCVAAARVADLPCSMRSDLGADVALTALGSNDLLAYRGIKLKLRYGVSLHRGALHHNLAMTRGFDGILAHGVFERDLFSRWFAPERIAIVGVPRHASYLAQPLTKLEARAQLGLPSDLAVIAYLPTWSVQSSLHDFMAPLLALARTQRVLIKPHALSLGLAAERASLAALERVGARVLGQSDSFAPLVAAADLVLADATSGAATEAALLAPDTPLVLLSRRATTELFCEIEQLGHTVRTPEDLPGVIARQLQRDDYRAQRSALCERLFFTQGAGARAPELAADAICALATLPKISGIPGFFARSWPRAARVLQGRAVALGVKWAALPPRDLHARDKLAAAKTP